MPELFRRIWAITVGTVRLSGMGAGGGLASDSLDCSFEIVKSTSREPNTASVQIYNLSPSHRRTLEASSSVALRIEAGYVGRSGILFDGDVSVAASRRRALEHRSRQSRLGSMSSTGDAVDVVTEIEAEDGGTSWRGARVQQSFAAGTPVLSVLRAAADAMGLGHGNLDEIATTQTLSGVSTYTEGTVLSGQAHHEMDRLVRSLGLRWSIQSGNVQLQRGTAPLAVTAVRLSPETGLIGSPAPDSDGYITAVSLLNAGLYPGRPVVLESREISGSYSVKRVTYSGDTAGADWYAETTLQER